MELKVSNKDRLKLIRSLCRDSLYYFILYFWDTIISEEIHDNWHIKALCDEIQPEVIAAINREEKQHDIVVNIAPGTTKTTIISQMLPAWIWTVKKESIVLTSTNSDKLSSKNAMRSKDIITSKKYQELFPDVVIRKDASAKTFYQNDAGGARFSFTTKGSKIGNHGDILIEDDPTTSRQSKSNAEMEAAEEGFKEFQTRKTNKKTSLYILLMQRLSPIDYTTIALNRLDKVKHICLPAEDSELVKPSHYRDKYIDGLLDPVRLSKEILEKERKALNNDEEGTSEDDYPAQYGQDPQAREGRIYDLNYYDDITNDLDAISLGAADIADQGTDYLAAPFAKIIGKKIYVHDAVYTQEPSAVSAPRLAEKSRLHDVIRLVCEKNNQGGTYITLLNQLGAKNVMGITSKGNKMNRIIAFAWIVNEYFYFKRTGSPEYMKFLRRLERILKTDTKEDDAADSITILAKYIYTNFKHIFQ